MSEFDREGLAKEKAWSYIWNKTPNIPKKMRHKIAWKYVEEHWDEHM